MLIKKSLLVISLATLLATTTGCAKKSEPTVVDYYPTCHEPLAYLHQRNGTGHAIASGAVQGAVISGIAAAIIGAISGGIRPVGMLTTIGVGATLGGATGAMASPQDKEDNAHLASYLEQIDGDIDGLDIVGAAATLSMQCYNREFKQLLEGMKEHNITEEAAQARFKEIIAGREEAAQLLHQPANTQQLQEKFNATQ